MCFRKMGGTSYGLNGPITKKDNNLWATKKDNNLCCSCSSTYKNKCLPPVFYNLNFFFFIYCFFFLILTDFLLFVDTGPIPSFHNQLKTVLIKIYIHKISINIKRDLRHLFVSNTWHNIFIFLFLHYLLKCYSSQFFPFFCLLI